MPYLIVSRGGQFEREIELGNGTLHIGRDPNNELVLDDPDRGVSRFHTEIRCNGTDYTVTDLESRNGTWIDGARISSMSISPDAVVTVGSYTLQYKADEAVSALPHDTTADYTVFSPPRAAPVEPSPLAAARRPGPPVFTIPRVPVARTRQALLFLAASIAVASLLGIGWYRGKGRRPASSQQQAPPPAPPKVESQEPPSGGGTPPNRDTPAEQEKPTTATSAAAPGVGGSASEPRPRPEKRRAEPRVAVDPGSVVRRPGESQMDWQARNRRVQDSYAAAKTAFSADDVLLAISRLEALERDEPSYLDVPTLLASARDAARTQAQQALDAAKSAEQSGALGAAVQAYNRAHQLIPAIDIDATISRLREEMGKQGGEAYRQARQREALDRTAEAVKLYERALALLPADDDRRQDASRRLQILKSKP